MSQVLNHVYVLLPKQTDWPMRVFYKTCYQTRWWGSCYHRKNKSYLQSWRFPALARLANDEGRTLQTSALLSYDGANLNPHQLTRYKIFVFTSYRRSITVCLVTKPFICLVDCLVYERNVRVCLTRWPIPNRVIDTLSFQAPRTHISSHILSQSKDLSEGQESLYTRMQIFRWLNC